MPTLNASRNQRNPWLRSALVLCALACSDPANNGCPDDVQNGCPTSALTYDTGIGALLTERCSPCHARGGVEANRLLTDYEHVSTEQMSIASQLVTCSMPPSGAPQLTREERQRILDWLSCGGR